MNTPTLVAAALPAVFGLALVAHSVMARRKELLRHEIGERVLRYRASAVHLPTLTRSAFRRENSELFSWCPAVAESIRAELAATGDRLRFAHLAIAWGVGGTLDFVLSLAWFGLPAPLAVLGAVVTGVTIPVMLLRRAQRRFQTRFLNGFPDALDLIVRAVRAGLPLGDAIESVGAEIADPVGKEFRQIHAKIAIGMDVEEELNRAADRIRAVDFRFFIIALSLQRRTGGNLAETLANLSLTIRRRKEIGLKARALMSEARASAWLISLLPFVAGGGLFLLNPDYMLLLVNDPRGTTMLALALVGIALGALAMRTMIRAALR